MVEQTLLNETSHLSWLPESDEKLDCWFARRRSDLNTPGLLEMEFMRETRFVTRSKMHFRNFSFLI